MPSERVQRQIDRLLDEAERAMVATDWVTVRQRCEAALALDPANGDARSYIEAADRADGTSRSLDSSAPAASAAGSSTGLETFANGRYEVVKFLGEGGRKKVYLAKDSLLDRQVAFALIKTEGLDEVARERITREAQTMGRLGAHPNVVTVLDIGEHDGQPFVVIELLGGGDVEGLLEDAGGPLPLGRSLEIALDVCRGLEFIHAKGIVHRDLKPGNVWLTTDGVAKIGDYGLAMSTDRTRLTLEGTMVGTVGYMPPEQALGGDITARSDLYSLGAMLYEMVTGRVPFDGDRITDVISQHINVVPEPPSARGAQIPLALEQLILQLLDKDPVRRPESAAEVANALEAIDPLDLVDPLDPEYTARRARGMFVGRSRELDELRSRFDEVMAGQSRIVMLVGQPGIGKTRLAQELEGYARSRGARVFWGRAPEGGGAPEYWLFHQMLRRFLEQVPVEVSRERLGDDAAQLARIAPEIRERLRGLPEPTDRSEFALFEAMRTFVHRLAETQPLVLVLDDLHWADSGSLALLQHASRDLQRARVMIVGTYRDTEMSRQHPLSQALATLNREPNFFRVAVRSLGRDEVSSYLEAAAGFEPTREQLDVFMRETDGNPFFLSEIVTSMLERRTLDDRTYELEIPDGMREALARRVNALSEDAVEMLKLAAVIGYDFDFSTLSIVSELDDDRELELIEEALGERVIAEGERAGTYRFVYQPMQRLLLDEISSTRQLRLHGQIAELLESSFGAAAEQRASVLAPHFAASAQLNSAHRDRAVRYSTIAGDAADDAGDWNEAKSHLAAAVLLLGDEANARPDLLRRLGRVEGYTLDFEAGQAHLSQAIDAFARAGDPRSAAEAARDAFVPNGPARDVELAEKALLVVSGVDSLAEARLEAWRGLAYMSDEQGAHAAARALELIGDEHADDVRALLEFRQGVIEASAGRLDVARSLYNRALERLESGDLLGLTLRARLAGLDLWAGEIDQALKALADVMQLLERQHAGRLLFASQAQMAAIYVLRWDLGRLNELVTRPGRPQSSVDAIYLPRVRELRGNPASALAWRLRNQANYTTGLTFTDLIGAATNARLRLAAGDIEGARHEIDWSQPIPDTGQAGHVVAHADDAFTRFAPREVIEDWVERPWDEAATPARATGLGSFERTRASWALALERLDEARRLAERGLEWCQRERLPVEEGRCHLLLSDVLREHGETREAARHLDAAGELFRRTGARLYLDQVLERRNLLKA
ncbi:MAG: protein kinase [Dehalococcoidia bacterium]